jgi:hypothetical protein
MTSLEVSRLNQASALRSWEQSVSSLASTNAQLTIVTDIVTSVILVTGPDKIVVETITLPTPTTRVYRTEVVTVTTTTNEPTAEPGKDRSRFTSRVSSKSTSTT